jgi:hypothetical protein
VRTGFAVLFYTCYQVPVINNVQREERNMGTPVINDGWQRLSNGFDAEFRHGVPWQLCDNGGEQGVPTDELLNEIAALGGLQVRLGEWQTGERPDEREARLFVSRQDFAEVLIRQARAAAALFVDRYQKPIDAGDTDWDRLEYLKDFQVALACCGLAEGDVDPDQYREHYLGVMHRETYRLARLAGEPPVEVE